MPVATVVWREGQDGSDRDAGLLAFSKEHLAGYKVPRKLYTVDTLPRVNGWKLLRRELREMFAQ